MALPALALVLLVPLGLVVAAAGAFLLYRLFFRGPKLGDDWPRIQGCRVEERSPDRWPSPPPPRRLKEISPAEYRTLCALCDTILPAFVDEAEIRAGARAYVEELLQGGAVSAAEKEAMVMEVSRDVRFYTYGALEAGAPLKVADVIEAQVPPDCRRLFRMVLRAFEMPLGILFLSGKWHGWRTPEGSPAGFSSLPFEARERIIANILTSPIGPTRGLMLLIKGMTGRVFFGSRGDGEDAGKPNPTWNALRYEDRTEAHVLKVLSGSSSNGNGSGKWGKGGLGLGLGGKKPAPSSSASALKPPQLAPLKRGDVPPSSVGGGTDVRELFCDVVIVGSGAGGGTAAGVLCQAGLDVVVLEKGGYFTEADFAKWGELEGEKGLYERSAYMASEELSIHVLAGSCVGGGTTLNWCASFRTPRHVRKDWAEARGLKQFASPEYDAALDAVCRRLNVNTEHSHANEESPSAPGLVVNGNNEALWRGAKAVGAQCFAIPRNVKGCKDCSGCERGCPYTAKQSTLATFLEDAQATKKMRLVARAHVEKVLRAETGQAIGVMATVQDEGEAPYKLIVWSEKAVIAAGGSLHTPALLLRSGLKNPKIGRHLAMHPVTGVAGLFPGQHFETHRGVGMGTYVPATMQGREGDGWGGAVETPPSHAGLSGVAVPWSSAFSYRVWALMRGQYAINIVISRDHSSAHNRIVVDKQGAPRIHYTLTPRDRRNLQHSVGTMLKMMTETGAALALPINDSFRSWRRGRDGAEGVDEYLKYLEAMGTPIASAQLFTAHQMCSCRMADSPSQGPVDEEGAVWETPGLYVMDASVFPTSLGINPMITVMAITMMNARRLARKIAGDGAVERIDARYGVPTPEEARGECCFPAGDTLMGEYGVSCEW